MQKFEFDNENFKISTVKTRKKIKIQKFKDTSPYSNLYDSPT